METISLADTTMSTINRSVTNQSTLSAPGAPRKFISDEILYWTEIIGYMALHGTVSICGIIANIINVIVFVRQGVLSDSNTFSLLALSTSDMCGLITLLWMSVCYMLLYIQPPNLPFDPVDMLFVTGGRPHLMFVQITSWITTYIAFERCMCVVFPFRVRRLFTAKRTAILLPSIAALIMFFGYLPYYLDEYLVWSVIPGTNRSILVLYVTYPDGVYDGKNIGGFINAIFSKTVTIFIVLVCNQIMAFRVMTSKKWRKGTSSSSSRNNTEKSQGTERVRSNEGDTNKQEHSKFPPNDEVNSKKEKGNREKRLVRMVTVISVIFIACMTPDFIFFALEQVYKPMIHPGGELHNLFFFNYAIGFFLEGVNASINIFVYYNLSTKYRCEFRKLFGMEG